MGFSFNGLSGAAVTLSGTVTTTPSTKTATVLSTAVIAAATTTTIGTVPANKKWRILSLNVICYAHTDAVVEQYAYIDLNGVKALDIVCAGKTAAPGNNVNSVRWNYEAAPVLTAAQTARLITGTTYKTAANISYVEEDA